MIADKTLISMIVGSSLSVRPASSHNKPATRSKMSKMIYQMIPSHYSSPPVILRYALVSPLLKNQTTGPTRVGMKYTKLATKTSKYQAISYM